MDCLASLEIKAYQGLSSSDRKQDDRVIEGCLASKERMACQEFSSSDRKQDDRDIEGFLASKVRMACQELNSSDRKQDDRVIEGFLASKGRMACQELNSSDYRQDEQAVMDFSGTQKCEKIAQDSCIQKISVACDVQNRAWARYRILVHYRAWVQRSQSGTRPVLQRRKLREQQQMIS